MGLEGRGVHNYWHTTVAACAQKLALESASIEEFLRCEVTATNPTHTEGMRRQAGIFVGSPHKNVLRVCR